MKPNPKQMTPCDWLREATSFRVCPRYTNGSPAVVDEKTFREVAKEEVRSWDRYRSGFYGETSKDLATKLGLGGICMLRVRSGLLAGYRYDYLTAQIEKPTTTDELRQSFRDAAAGPLKGILAAVDEPLVSIDFKGDPHSSSVDLQFTMVLGKEAGDFIKVVSWYDNEWGYAVRTADLAHLIASKL